MNTTKIKAVLFKSKTYKDGSHPIMIRMTQNRKLMYTAVGHAIRPDAWDCDTCRVYEKVPKITKRQEGQLNPAKLLELKERYKHAIVLHNAITINSDIEDKLNEVDSVSTKLKVNEQVADLKTIKQKLNPTLLEDRSKSFLTYAHEYRDNVLAEGAYTTYKRYKTIITKLEEYLGSKDLLFADVTVDFLKSYKAHLQTKGNGINTIYNNLKSIRAIFYSAISNSIISGDKNPFFVFKLTTEKVRKEKLSIENIIAIERLKFKPGSILYNARNTFLFSFYCAGIRISDLLQLKWGNVNSEGRLEYRMDKTGVLKSISLTPKAKEILSIYRDKASKPDDFIFPFVDPKANLKDKATLHTEISRSTALINKFLKEIATKADITKVISTHIARHSFADIARTKKASVYDISKMLGHSSIKITEAYLASLDIDSQDETMKSVLNY